MARWQWFHLPDWDFFIKDLRLLGCTFATITLFIAGIASQPFSEMMSSPGRKRFRWMPGTFAASIKALSKSTVLKVLIRSRSVATLCEAFLSDMSLDGNKVAHNLRMCGLSGSKQGDRWGRISVVKCVVIILNFVCPNNLRLLAESQVLIPEGCFTPPPLRREGLPTELGPSRWEQRKRRTYMRDSASWIARWDGANINNSKAMKGGVPYENNPQYLMGKRSVKNNPRSLRQKVSCQLVG